jgi:RNA polymerase primary sigma factor
VPVHMIEATNKVVRTSRRMLNEIGREPTPDPTSRSTVHPLYQERGVPIRWNEGT